jgi:UDP-3-O-[3-hydroxymyristoyl] glucosamine N-acyltransferase
VVFTIRQLADWVGGVVHGDDTITIDSARPLSDAHAGDLTFVDGEKNLDAWKQSQAVAAVGPKGTPHFGKPFIEVADPLFAFSTIFLKLRGEPAPTLATIDTTARIHPTVILGEGCSVGPYAILGEGTVLGARCQIHAAAIIGRNCILGDDATVYPHVVLYDDCVLGQRVTIHANSVIGADGFGYRFQAGKHVKVPQLGNVIIGDDVEIGACTTIDRGTFTPTTIGEGTKLDNHVQIAHNCKIGKHNLLVSQVGIAGSCTTGDYVVMAGQVGVGDHINIGEHTTLGARSGVHKDIPPNSQMMGAPPRPMRDAIRILMSLDHLPEMRKDVMRIKKHLGLTEDAK